MIGFACPYCGSEHECCYEGESELSINCDACGRSLDVDVYLEPCYEVRIPPELSNCRECDYWNILDFCSYDESSDCDDVPPLRSCPIGKYKDWKGRGGNYGD